MKNLIIGIDPGKSGAFCEMWPDGRVDTFDMPGDADMRDYFKNVIQFNTPTVYLEQVGGFIGKAQPGHHMFVFGDGFGCIRGMLLAYHIKFNLIRPQKWQAGIPGMTSLKGPDRKKALKEHAARLHPNLKVTLSNADAILIAAFGKTQEGNQ